MIDVAIVGAGHNGLVLGCYLAKAGLEVVVFERRLEAGGGLSTEEATRPGFLHNLHSVFHDGVAVSPVYKDLDLAGHGLRYLLPPVQVGLALRDGRALCVHLDPARTRDSLSRILPRDAGAWLRAQEDHREFMEAVVLPALFSPPAPPSAASLALEGTPEGRELLRLSRLSPLDAAADLFDDPAVQAAALFQLAIPRGIAPDAAGLGVAVPLVVSGVEPSHLAAGGSHSMAHALWRCLLRAGGRLRGCAEVARIRFDGNRAAGVVLSGGEEIAARAVVSAIDLPQTFQRLVGEERIDPALADRVRRYRLDEFSIFSVHLALREPPRYAAARFDPDLDRALKVAVGFDGPHDFRRHWEEIRRGEVPTARFYACSPTVHDPSQAPPGGHTAFLWMPAPYQIARGTWDERKEQVADACLARWQEAAPNLAGAIIARRAYSPLDIERKLASMPRGSIFGGRISLDQIEDFRPLPELSQYRTSVPGLYLAGACTHPGGGILGACAYNGLQILAEDLGVDRWWEQQP